MQTEVHSCDRPSPLRKMKDFLRPVPGLRWAYINLMIFVAYARFCFEVDDTCRVKDDWDFELPFEQRRQKIALDMVESQVGDSAWGDVLEIGSHTGVFTVQLAHYAKTVSACEVSDRFCQAAALRCVGLPAVNVHNLNVLTDSINGKYDLAFAMGVLCFFKGRARLSKVAGKLSNALREGGILVLQEMRLPPEVEGSAWIRWTCEGGLQIRDLLCNRSDLRLIREQIDTDFVTVLYEKVSEPRTTKTWKRFIPRSLKSLYGDLRVARTLFSEFNTISLDSIRAVRKITSIHRHSLVSPIGLKQLYDLATDLDKTGVAGDFVECGVYRGGSAALLGSALMASKCERHLWLFDSFQGLPPADPIDGPSAATLTSKLVGSESALRDLLGRCGIPSDKTHIYPGWFNDTLKRAPIQKVALLHIDADWYASVKQCLEHFYDLVEPGGIIVLDDYDEWPGCKAALDEFAAARSLRINLEGGREAPVFFRKSR